MMPPLVSSHFPSQFFRTLQQFRDSRYLCDVRLIADGEIEFPAHRLVLAISSPFFSDLFQAKKDAQDVTTVHLRNCSADCVQILLQFLYSGELQLKECDPGKVLSVARACRIHSLEQMLASYVNTQSPSAASPSNKSAGKSPKLEPDSSPAPVPVANTGGSSQQQGHKRKAKTSTVSISGDQQIQQVKMEQQRKTSNNKASSTASSTASTMLTHQQQALLASSGAGRLLAPPIPQTAASSIFMQNAPPLCPIHGVFGCTCPFANVVAASNAGINAGPTDPAVAAALQQLFFGAAAAAAAAAAAQATELSNDGHKDEDMNTTSGVAYGPPLPKVARMTNKASANGPYMGSQNGELHCQLPTTPANPQLTNQSAHMPANLGNAKRSSGCDTQPTTTPEAPQDGQTSERGSLNTVQVPADDKEGWCRNKKYIKKTPQGYQCTVCKKTYGRYNSVSYHVTIYHRNPPIQCDQPGCTFSTREARYIHFHKYYRHDVALPTNIDLESRRCPFCKHVAKSPAMLEKHINRHMPECIRVGRTYHCDLCKKELGSRHALVQHMIVHEQEKGLSCDQCSYRGRTPENLQQHKLFKHSNAGDLWCAKHQCDECQFSTPSKAKLTEHQRHVHCKDDVVSNSVSSTTLSDTLKPQDEDDGHSGGSQNGHEDDHENGSGANLHMESDEDYNVIDHEDDTNDEECGFGYAHHSGTDENLDEEDAHSPIHGDDECHAGGSIATTTDPSPEGSN